MIDAWKIGVNIAMTSNAAAVLGVLQRDLFGLHRSVDLLTGKLNLMKVAAVGAMSAMAGGAVLVGMAKLVEHGREFVHQQALMKAAALELGEITGATADAWKIAGSVAGSTATGNLKLLADLRNVLGSMDGARTVAPEFAKIATVLQSVTGKPGENQAYEFARFLELRGALVDPKTHEISTERLMQQSRMAQAIIVGTQGRVGPRDLLMFQQQARGAGAMLSDEGLLNAVPFIQASGGFRAGTSMAAITQQLVGGVMTVRSADWLNEIGALPKSAIDVRRGGKVVIDKNQIAGADMIASDPAAWAVKVLMPLLQKKYGEDQDAITKALLQSGMRQTTTGGLIEFIRNSPAFAKEVENILRVYKAPQTPYESLQQNDPTTKINNFKAAWENLMTALGVPLVEPATDMLNGMAKALTSMSQWAAKNPELVGALELTAAGVAGLAVAIGLFAVGTAAASALGLLTGPVGLVALAIGIEAFGKSMTSLPPWLVNMAAGAAAGAAVGARFGGGVGGAFGALVGGGAGLASSIPDGVGPDLSRPGSGPSSITNEPVGAGIKRFFGFGPPPRASGASGPIPVIITNPGAVGDAAARGTVNRIERDLSRSPTGGPAADPRLPWSGGGSAAFNQ